MTAVYVCECDHLPPDHHGRTYACRLCRGCIRYKPDFQRTVAGSAALASEVADELELSGVEFVGLEQDLEELEASDPEVRRAAERLAEVTDALSTSARLAKAERLLEYALHLRQHGEHAPGGNETWAEFDRNAEAFLRHLGPPRPTPHLDAVSRRSGAARRTSCCPAPTNCATSIARTPKEHSMPEYDSTADTLKHSLRVGELMGQPIRELVARSTQHDRSKTEDPELATFNEFTPKLKHSTYGSDEYKGFLASMKTGLDHHYAHNRHHPEHFENGVTGMTLVDLIEMLADWKAATERHADGSLVRSLVIQKERFGISDQLDEVLRNTARWFGWLDGAGSDG